MAARMAITQRNVPCRMREERLPLLESRWLSSGWRAGDSSGGPELVHSRIQCLQQQQQQGHQHPSPQALRATLGSPQPQAFPSRLACLPCSCSCRHLWLAGEWPIVHWGHRMCGNEWHTHTASCMPPCRHSRPLSTTLKSSGLAPLGTRGEGRRRRRRLPVVARVVARLAGRPRL